MQNEQEDLNQKNIPAQDPGEEKSSFEALANSEALPDPTLEQVDETNQPRQKKQATRNNPGVIPQNRRIQFSLFNRSGEDKSKESASGKREEHPVLPVKLPEYGAEPLDPAAEQYVSETSETKLPNTVFEQKVRSMTDPSLRAVGAEAPMYPKSAPHVLPDNLQPMNGPQTSMKPVTEELESQVRNNAAKPEDLSASPAVAIQETAVAHENSTSPESKSAEAGSEHLTSKRPPRPVTPKILLFFRDFIRVPIGFLALAACLGASLIAFFAWMEYRKLRTHTTMRMAEVEEEKNKLNLRLEESNIKLHNVQIGVGQLQKMFENMEAVPEKPQYEQVGDGVIIYWVDGILWRRYHVYQAEGKKGDLRKLNKRSTKKNFIFVKKLKTGVWRYAVTALDREGQETDMSEELEITVR